MGLTTAGGEVPAPTPPDLVGAPNGTAPTPDGYLMVTLSWGEEAVECVVADDGAFTVPAADLASGPCGPPRSPTTGGSSCAASLWRTGSSDCGSRASAVSEGGSLAEISYAHRAERPFHHAGAARFHEPSESTLNAQTESWKVYALINRDVSQIFIGALSLPMSQMDKACKAIAAEIVDWEPTRHNVSVEVVEQFPTQRHAQAYARWLMREGAFEGVEHFAMGVDAALA